MPLVVDAYNVLHVTGVLHPDRAGVEVEDLVELIHNSRYRKEDVCLICDGERRMREAENQTNQTGHLRVIYAGAGRSADDQIELMIDRSSAPRRLIIVTSDLRLVRAAKRRRCKQLRSDVFLAQLERDAHRQVGSRTARRHSERLSDAEVRYWLRVFGLDDESV
ncbi:MAG: NYN domain-containing protein [Phycisphaerales bacterium]